VLNFEWNKISATATEGDPKGSEAQVLSFEWSKISPIITDS